jgi:head-tail adaptor
MSFGKMNPCIDLVQKVTVKDSEAFPSKRMKLSRLSDVREGRHGSEKWANRAQFSEATDLFRFRQIPNVTVTTAMVVENKEGRFEITSVENVKGRGMYIEVLAKEVKQSG